MNEFDQQARGWDNDPVRVLRARAVADAIRNHVPLTARMTAMEYGCGTGLLSCELRGDIGPITLADSSEGMLEVLRDKIAAVGAVNMTPMKLDLAVNPLPADRFDLVYNLMTLHHIPDTERALRNFHALLRPNGWLAVCDLDKEDGSFHDAGFEGHNGFDRCVLEQKYSVLWLNNVLFVNAALKSQYEARDFPVDQRRSYNIAQVISAQEIESYGEKDERVLPPGQGNGFIWRLQSIARYEERDGGVYVELEAIGLTRDIPASLRWMANPLVARLSRSTLAMSLRQTREGVAASTREPRALASCGTRGFRGGSAVASEDY